MRSHETYTRAKTVGSAKHWGESISRVMSRRLVTSRKEGRAALSPRRLRLVRELAQRQWWATQCSVAEPSDGSPQPYRHRAIVERFDHRELVLEVPRADLGGEHHCVAHTQLGDRVRGEDRVQELTARMDGVGNRNKVLVELACHDLLEQLPLRQHQLAVIARGPQQRLVVFQSSDVWIILPSADIKLALTPAVILGGPHHAD